MNAASIQSFFPGQTQDTTPEEPSPSSQEAVEEIAQSRHKGVTWCGEADAKTNKPGDSSMDGFKNTNAVASGHGASQAAST
eukprot:CAMPEP_0194323586 /NCGR_PEP_ID=MMETSP0171-20130528/25837_1 /TAXON_ID=218684 /ORGANISM="Corethron pennatum, Strain L29A3" /LENGTH=80 /DNA_ID=CAMNT_0039082265 /DNA_START=149 /DNA_END=390 /DNA_ORIENTATION=+